jgi:predicted membrane channel-forming protein YqfA (hemolysin III family)
MVNRNNRLAFRVLGLTNLVLALALFAVLSYTHLSAVITSFIFLISGIVFFAISYKKETGK